MRDEEIRGGGDGEAVPKVRGVRGGPLPVPNLPRKTAMPLSLFPSSFLSFFLSSMRNNINTIGESDIWKRKKVDKLRERISKRRNSVENIFVLYFEAR